MEHFYLCTERIIVRQTRHYESKRNHRLSNCCHVSWVQLKFIHKTCIIYETIDAIRHCSVQLLLQPQQRTNPKPGYIRLISYLHYCATHLIKAMSDQTNHCAASCGNETLDQQIQSSMPYWSVSNSFKWDIQSLAKYSTINFTGICGNY